MIDTSSLRELLNDLVDRYWPSVLAAILILVGFWIAARIVRALLTRALRKTKFDKATLSFTAVVVQYLIMIVGLVTALSSMGVPPSSVIAVLGAATLAIGLALQDSLGNLAGGVIIIMTRPYKGGDYIQVNGVRGFVTEVQLLHTLLHSRDNRAIFVPNKAVIAGNIENFSKEDKLRLDLVFGIHYDDDLRLAKSLVLEVVNSDTRIARDPKPVIAVGELAESSVNIVVQCFVGLDNMKPVEFDLIEQVKLRFDEQGITIRSSKRVSRVATLR